MASLLDMVVAQRNPRLAGLLGDGSDVPMQQQIQTPSAQPLPMIETEQAAPQQEQAVPQQAQGSGGGPLGFLGTAFTGPSDPRLSPEENAHAQRQALILGGLSALSARGHDAGGAANALLMGNTFGSQIREQQVQAKRERMALRRQAEQEQEMAAALEANDTSKLQTLQGELALQGNTDAAKTIGTILESKGVGAEAIQVDLNNGRTAMVNPVTNQVEAELGVPDDQEVERADLGNRVVWHVKGEPENILAVEPKGISPDKQAQLTWEREKEARRRALEESGVLTDEQSSLMNTLADDIRADARDPQFVADAARTLTNMPDNAASDLTLVASLTRITDPGASVRQSDVENATNIGGLSAAAQQWINRLKSQGEFSEEQRALLKNEAMRVARNRQVAWRQRLEKFRNRARTQGLPEEAIKTIAIDPFAGMDLGGGGGSGAADDPFADLGG